MELFFMRRNRSPILLAVIFITFFHSVLSRHRIRHYKDRFKRQQGAHLYLPDSYVTEGGEGTEEGAWLDWSEPSPCSRTCGGGVSTQFRQCQQGYSCQGPDRRHFSCNTQDCPDTGDYRSQQCSEYDEVPFENIKYQWVPYTKGPSPCELNCMPKGQRFYYRHAPQVVDGTRCNDESFDICVNGQCQPVGCDMMLGSDLKEDECRVCGGDGSTCNTVSNTLELNDLQVGYNDILLIPGGATNIVVEEVAPSNNYFAVRNTSGHYYLNGNWRIDLPRAIDFAGSKFHYERYPQGFAAPDKIYTLGPIDEPLFIVLLYQDTTVPVQYKYSLPTNVQPGSESETYAWTFDEFTPCSATCGGGIQHRNVSCAGRKTLDPVDEKLCDAARKPETTRKCNEIACEAHWIPHPWGNCSTPCGKEGGVQSREISCQQIVSNGYPSLVDESECLGPKPPQQQKCNQGKTCATWHTGPWKPCDHLCGDGKQTRKVQCFIKDAENKIEILEEPQCQAIEPKPTEEQKCFLRPCEGVDWITSEWSGCDSVCGLNNETRKIFCATAGGQIYGDDLCEQNEKPEIVRKCEGNNNASCNYLWYASQWSECSVKCGKGIQTRTLFCGLSTAKGVEKVEKDKCDQSKSFETLKNCTGTEECDGEWFSGPWGECSKPCGGGKRSKKVVCVKGNQVVDISHCDAENIIFGDEECNEKPCTEDSILPLDKEESLPLEESETEEPSTVASSIVTDKETKETDGTQSDISPSDISEITKSFEITTEPDESSDSDKEPEENEEDYEIVPSDSCDDGEWVEVVGVLEEEEIEPTDLTKTTDFMDMMYSDGTSFGDTLFTGSGDGETHPSTEKSSPTVTSSDFTEEEGSGETSSIITDVEETSIGYISSSQIVSGSTEENAGTSGITVTERGSDSTEGGSKSDVSATTEELTFESVGAESYKTSISPESSKSTDISQTSKSSEISEITDASKVSEITDSSKISETTETSKGSETTKLSKGSESTDALKASEITDASKASEATDASKASETTDASNASETTDASKASETTDASNASETTDASKASETTDASKASETTDVSNASETTDASKGSETTDASKASETTDASSASESTDASDASESTTESELSTTATVVFQDIPPHECQAVFDECAALQCLYGIQPYINEDECNACRCKDPCKDIHCDKEKCDIDVNINEKVSHDAGYIATCREKISSTETPTSSSDFTTDTDNTETLGTSISTDPSISLETITEISGSSDNTESTTDGMATSTSSSSSTEDNVINEEPGADIPTPPSRNVIEEEEDETTTASGPSSSTEISASTTVDTTELSGSTGTDGSASTDNAVKVSSTIEVSTEMSGTMDLGGTTAIIGSTEMAGPTEMVGSTETAGSTEITGSTEMGGSTKMAGSTENAGSTEMVGSTEMIGSTKETGATEMAGSTEMASSTEMAGSTDMASTTESAGSTEMSGSTTDSGSTEMSGTTEISGSTEQFTTEIGGSTETTESGGTESTTEFSGSTEFDIFSSTTESNEGTTWPTSHITDIFKKKQKMCKRKKILQCQKSKYGCCWDNIHSAEGPFDKGCPAPKTCKESTYGCCSDGVSAALGHKNRGCPASHCNETLFGCCWDKKTPAEGNNEEGCPPKPPACLESKWGCCKDNITEAKGPKQKGCEEEEEEDATEVSPVPSEECSKTEFGCCPDQTPAEGPRYQGCNIPCANTTFGCCTDQETPAHGYRGEGCCLTAPFGCCPDDITPARGANGDGCNCQYTPYGCCPDNVTPANGYNKEGCGCKHSEHGCCPDDNTPAYGLDYEGCPCHTYQFGCCPDGVSVADGPHQQGCDCRSSEHGCCSDEKTPAQGPNKEGCGCEISKYGCCLDGVSDAKGDNFEGCEEVPVDHQNSCSLPKERGPCRNYTVKWFFDMSYGGCSRFWYGGCDGNDNRFRSKEECEGVCVKPQGTDRCNLPKVQGSCEGYFLQWHYDKESKHCMQFVYGGCLGNNNRFETREECSELCASDDSIDPCEQSSDEGPCRGQYRRYFFDKTSGQCRDFIYGGCKGNSNNFATIESCKQKCATPGQKRDYCTIPKAEGNCTAREAKWFYGAQEGRCLPFYYTGCNSNKNSFNSKEACQADCPTEVVKDNCHLPADNGECGNYVNRWYWDTKNRRCMQFYWGGCGGNGNNFQTEQECEQSCLPREPEPQPPEVPEPDHPRPEDQVPITQRPWPTPQVPSPTSRTPSLDEICSYTPDAGPCSDYSLHYYYDGVYGVCKNFTYGGCGGNYNNFPSEDICLQYCGSSRPLPPVQEPVPTSAPVETVGTELPPVQVPPVDDTQCYQEPDPGNCTDSYPAFHFDRSSGQCKPFNFTGCGGNRNRFYSEEDCERRCGSYRGQDTCNLERDTGPCRGYLIKYYYDRNAGRCGQFVYGGCQGNGNRFSSAEECEHYCGRQDEPKPSLTSAEVCQLPADQGSCPEANHRRWYFDNTQGECKVFIYTGCGGNQNNFKAFQKCLEYCKDFLPLTEPPAIGTNGFAPRECQRKFDECNTLRCPYGIEAYVDENDCNGCRCRDPCKDIECPEETQCGIDLNRNKTSPQDADFVAVCRERNKPGQCPYSARNDSSCDNFNECENDADCALHLKCCETNCGRACLEPARPQELVTQTSEPGYTSPSIVDVYYAPRVDVETYEPEVTALLGDQAVLNCAVTGNPNPKIAWSKDNIIIDGTQPRYRIRLDQTLQIITLHKTDSGVYLCTAENHIGSPIQNQIKLEVQDSPADRPVTILNGDDPELLISNVVTSFNSPATLNCYALGWPLPAVTWWKEDELIPLKNREFEVTKDYSLIVHSVQLHNLGVYTCQAYNGKGKASSWSVTIRAKGPYYSNNPEDIKYLQYVVNNPPERTMTTESTVNRASPSFDPNWPVYPPVQRPTPEPYIPPVYSTEPSPDLIDPNEIMPEIPDAEGHRVPPPDPVYVVPVRANITTNDRRYPTGSNVEIPCDVYGYPPPQVEWYKDGVPLIQNERITESDTHTLTIKASEKSDSGRYQCEAVNQYSKASSTIDILIEGMYIHPSCTDNQFFANCKLIVKAKYCNHKYYAKFCCRSCTEAGELAVDGPHLGLNNKQNALDTNVI